MSDPVAGVTFKSAGAPVTRSVTDDSVTTPFALVTTTWYVVVTRGETPRLPFEPTMPISGLMTTSAALEDDHVRLADSPNLMVPGDAVRAQLGSAAACCVDIGGGSVLACRARSALGKSCCL